MSEDDDQHWLDALAGKPPGEAELSTLKEAAVVRHAMLASQEQRRAPQLDVEQGLRRLLARMRAERLLEEPPRRRFRWMYPAVAAAACLVLAFGLAIRPQTPPQRTPPLPEIPVMRGGPDAYQEMVLPEVQELADEMSTVMTNVGLPPAVSVFGSVIRIEADWPSRPSAKQLDFLRDYGLAKPSGPRLKIEIKPPQQK